MILPARYPQASSRPQPFILVWVGEGMGGGNYGDFAPMRHHYPPSPPPSYFLWQSCKWNPSISLSPPALFLLNAGWQPILPLQCIQQRIWEQNNLFAVTSKKHNVGRSVQSAVLGSGAKLLSVETR